MKTAASNLLAKFLNDCKASGLSRGDAAKAIGVSQSTLLDYERGRKRPKAVTAARIEMWTDGKIPADTWLTSAERRGLEAVVPYERKAC